MHQKSTSLKDVRLTLQERYPQLAELLNDLDGFYKSILIRLSRFNLHNRYSPIEVTSECVCRLHKALEKGQDISNLDAWMKATAFNVVRELNREIQKASLYEPSILEEVLSNVLDESTDEADERHRIVRRALTILTEDKRELLKLRFFQNLTWDQVAEFYTARGEKIAIATLRKRGQRAQDDLRKVLIEMLAE